MMFGKNPGTDQTWKRIPEGSVGAELGVWQGDSSEKFLKRAGHVHLVDSWSPVVYEESDEEANDNASRGHHDEGEGGMARTTTIPESSSGVCNQGARLNCANQHEAPDSECTVPDY